MVQNREHLIAGTRVQLGEDTFNAAGAHGLRMTERQISDCAFEIDGGVPSQPR